LRPPPPPTLFPYTTLFRSESDDEPAAEIGDGSVRAMVRAEGTAARAIHLESADDAQPIVHLDARRRVGVHPREQAMEASVPVPPDRKSTRLNSSHVAISYA